MRDLSGLKCVWLVLIVCFRPSDKIAYSFTNERFTGDLKGICSCKQTHTGETAYNFKVPAKEQYTRFFSSLTLL